MAAGGESKAHREIVFAIAADYERRTGGWIYDDRLMRELARAGWRIRNLTLPAGFPNPDARACARASAQFAGIADGTTVVVDQLCLGVLPEVARRECRRLTLVMIVHHALALEESGVPGLDRALERAERAALRYVALVIVTSEDTARDVRLRYAVPSHRIVVALPGVDARPAARGSGAARLSLLCVGAVVPRKDHGALLAALSGLQHLPWHLTIVGNLTRAATHVAGLRARLAELGLVERVTMTGEIDENALEGVWRMADVYVGASRHEGFGLAVAEAVARGLPVVTTAAGAVAGWLSRRAAIVVPSGDLDGLGASLGRVLTHRPTREAMRLGALMARHQLPRWDEAALRVDAALSDLCDRRGQGRSLAAACKPA